MNNSQSLRGIRVLDFTQFLSGPFCTQILADLGAEVIKVESPEGDLSRHIPPYYVEGDSLYFLSINRNKKSLALDLKKSEGAEIARRLALKSDVVIENFRPGVMDKLGMSYSELRRESPNLIWCSISGFGQTGPYRDKPAYDMIVQALSGGMSLTGEVGGPSVRAGVPIGDLTAGLYGAIAILAALNKRNTSGEGEFIDISMLDCQAALLCYQGAYFLNSGVVPGHQGRGHDSIPTYRAFAARDGIDVVVTANTERMWTGLCSVLGCKELADDARFSTGRLRHTNRGILWPLLETAFRQRDAKEWVELLEREHIPVGVVNSLDQVAEDPQIRARSMVMEMKATDGRRATVIGDPLAGGTTRSVGYPPALGENSDTILNEILDIEKESIEVLVRDGVISLRSSASTKSPTKIEPRGA